jgi:hypothetical protein
MKLKDGVIIIGSLLWEEGEKNKRKDWRDSRLTMEDKERVRLPIRYGRISRTRANTYTMVYSKSVKHELGYGWIIPLKNKINSFEDLKKEAEAMGKAEGFENSLCSDWGSVSLIIKSSKKSIFDTRNNWPRLLKGKGYDATINENVNLLDEKGFLNIKLPDSLEFEFLLTTVTKPKFKNNLKGFPDSEEIVRAMEKGGYYEYFIRNWEHGIMTSQDKGIWQRINEIRTHD